MISRRAFVAQATCAIGLAKLGAAETSPAQLGLFNQPFFTLDRATTDAIETSPLLHAITTVHLATDSGIDKTLRTWTGRYINMKSSFLEIFGPGDAPQDGPNVGSFGIFFNVPEPAQYELLLARLKAAKIDVRSTNQMEDKPNAFRAIEIEGADPYMGEPGPSVQVAALQNLKRPYAGYKGGLLEDLTGAVLAVDRKAYELALRSMLMTLGLRMQETSKEVIFKGDGAGLRLVFTAHEQTGVQELTFKLSHSVPDQRRETIGHSELVVGPGTTARWTFQRG